MRGPTPVPLMVAALICTSSCDDRQPVDRRVRTSGVTIRLRPDDPATYSEGSPRYARVRLTPKADLLLDERFDWIVPPDFMSVLPVSRGQGTRRRMGRFEVACMADPPSFYACGTRLTYRSMPFVLLFLTPPASEGDVTEQVAVATDFLSRRVEPLKATQTTAFTSPK